MVFFETSILFTSLYTLRQSDIIFLWMYIKVISDVFFMQWKQSIVCPFVIHFHFFRDSEQLSRYPHIWSTSVLLDIWYVSSHACTHIEDLPAACFLLCILLCPLFPRKCEKSPMPAYNDVPWVMFYSIKCMSFVPMLFIFWILKPLSIYRICLYCNVQLKLI